MTRPWFSLGRPTREPVGTSIKFGDLLAHFDSAPPPQFVIELGDDGSDAVRLLADEAPVFEGAVRDAVEEMHRRGLKTRDRYSVRNAEKEIELQALSRADRAAGAKAIVARRDLTNEEKPL